MIVALASFSARVIIELAFDDARYQDIFEPICRKVIFLLNAFLQTMFVELNLPLHNAIPVVLDGVVGAALDHLSENSPFVSV